VTGEEQPMINEALAQEMERRGFPSIAAAIRRPVNPKMFRSLEDTCPWLVEEGRHVAGTWVPHAPILRRAA